MAHFLFKATYSAEGVRGIAKEGAASRLAVVKRLVKSLGGKVEVAYWAFGDSDFILVAALPDNSAAAALSMTVSASGAVGISTTPLLTAEDVDKGLASSASYRAPGA